MKLTQWLIAKLLFGFTLFFAAGAPPAIGGDDASGVDAGDLGYGDGDSHTEVAPDTTDGSDADKTHAGDDSDTERLGDRNARPEEHEEPELKEFKGLASSRLRTYIKEAPGLAQVFKEHPEVQTKFEATLRRDAAYREAFPTVAEANQMRQTFPNGMEDVRALQEDIQETEQLDRDFYGRDREGNYPGHTRMLENMFENDREATLAMLRSVPNQWAKLDPASYNEAFSQIIGRTFTEFGIPEFVSELVTAAKDAKQDGIATQAQKLLNWLGRFTAEKPRPSAAEEKLARDRAELNRERAERSRQDTAGFNREFLRDSRKLQTDIIQAHPAIKRLASVQGISAEKKQRIVEEIRGRMEKLLARSPSFMKKLRPAYDARKLDETLNLQKTAWSQQWLLNKMVREVLKIETPQMIQSSRDAVRRRMPPKAPVKAGESKPAGTQPPKKIGGRWYRDGGKGAPFTTAEILANKHQQ